MSISDILPWKSPSVTAKEIRGKFSPPQKHCSAFLHCQSFLGPNSPSPGLLGGFSKTRFSSYHQACPLPWSQVSRTPQPKHPSQLPSAQPTPSPPPPRARVSEAEGPTAAAMQSPITTPLQLFLVLWCDQAQTRDVTAAAGGRKNSSSHVTGRDL